MPGEAEARIERVDHVEAVDELAGGVGRVAEVVVEGDPAEEVVAGHEHSALRLVEADVGRGVPGGLVDVEGPEIGVDLHARQQVAVGQHHAGDPNAAPPLALRVLLQRLLGHAALACHLEPPLEPAVGILGDAGHVPVVGVHPQLAAGGVHDRAREAVVVGVRVGAHEQPDVLEPEPGLVESALELRQRARLVESGVDEDHPRARSDHPGVHVRDAGPRQGQSEAPDAREDAIRARKIAPAAGVGHPAIARQLIWRRAAGLLAHGELHRGPGWDGGAGLRPLAEDLAALALRRVLLADLADLAARARDRLLRRRELLPDDLRHVADRGRTAAAGAAAAPRATRR